MGGGVGETFCRQAVGLQHQARGHGPITIQPFPHGDTRVQRLHHTGKTPHGDVAPAFFGAGEELPVAHRVAKRSVGDVVGRQRKVVDTHTHLSVGQRLVGQGVQACGAELVFANLELCGVHGVRSC